MKKIITLIGCFGLLSMTGFAQRSPHNQRNNSSAYSNNGEARNSQRQYSDYGQQYPNRDQNGYANFQSRDHDYYNQRNEDHGYGHYDYYTNRDREDWDRYRRGEYSHEHERYGHEHFREHRDRDWR